MTVGRALLPMKTDAEARKSSKRTSTCENGKPALQCAMHDVST